MLIWEQTIKDQAGATISEAIVATALATTMVTIMTTTINGHGLRLWSCIENKYGLPATHLNSLNLHAIAVLRLQPFSTMIV